jgi:hypothetical protein
MLPAALAMCAFATSARADTITISPPAPNPSDSVYVIFDGEFALGCWDVESWTCTRPSADSVVVTANIQYCAGQPSCVCTAFPEVYQVICDFPPLPVGVYTAVYREVNLNVYDYRAPVVMSREFTVTGPTPAMRRSWAKVKAYYR